MIGTNRISAQGQPHYPKQFRHDDVCAAIALNSKVSGIRAFICGHRGGMDGCMSFGSPIKENWRDFSFKPMSD
jgi:hypothetical protein